MIQDHLNHLYHPVTVQRETYEKLKLQHPKLWITSMSNELGCLASVVGDRIASRTYKYNPVTVQRETYEKLKLQHPKLWINSMSNELGQLDSGVGDRMAYGSSDGAPQIPRGENHPCQKIHASATYLP